MKTIFLFAATLLLAARLAAQTLTVDWSTVDGGGGASSDGTLVIEGTAGQPDAGTLSDGALTVQGGFWPAFTATSASTSANGYQVYYSVQSGTAGSNYIGVVNSDGSGNAHVLDTACWPRLSPDGTKLLYHPVQNTGNFAQNHLAAYNLNTSSSMNIFGNNNLVVYYDWAPGGNNVLFDYACGILLWNANTFIASGFLIGSDCNDDAPSVNPQGGNFAFHNQYQGLLLADMDGSARRHVPNTSGGDFWPNWSPDGQWLVFRATEGGYAKIKQDGTGRTNLWSQIPGASQVTLYGQLYQAAVCFSPDGQWVIAPFILNGTNGIYALAADGSGTVKTILAGGLSGDQIYNFIGGILPATLDSGAPPVLTISAATPGQATISWTPATPGFVLQESGSLAPASWINSASGTQNPVTIPTGNAASYYRLVKP